MTDAGDCAGYLTGLRRDGNWTRFDAAMSDYLMRPGEFTIPERRQLLAEAYHAIVPDDVDAYDRIQAAT